MVKSKRPVKFIDFTDEIRKSLFLKKQTRNPRVKLESWQLSKLIEAYEEDTHPSQKTKTRLSILLSLSLKSVQIWFQNKRAKEKSKREREEAEVESAQASRLCNAVEESFLYSDTQHIEESHRDIPHNLFTDSSSFNSEFDTLPSIDASYDDCYNAISSIADMQTSSFEKNAPSLESDKPFLSFSPFTLTKAPSIQSKASAIKEAAALPDIYAEQSRYKFQFRNRSIIYGREESSLDLLNCIYSHTHEDK